MTFSIPYDQKPYRNLILTGTMGVGRPTVGRLIAQRIGVEFIDFSTEVELRENATLDEIRARYGNLRATQLEAELCRELALKRGSVLSMNASVLLEAANRERLLTGGIVLVLTCALGQALRRLYVASGERFHDPKERLLALGQIKREKLIHQLPDIPTLDTTYLSVEETAGRALQFWYERETVRIDSGAPSLQPALKQIEDV